jgi:murein DD-endopeptidase MepM/ murein hydrolase activator NlpD
MSCVPERLRARLWPRAAVLTLMAIGVAGCSSDTTRFNDNPFANNPSAPETTGTVWQGQGAPAGRVDSRPLPPQAAQAQPANAAPIKLATANPGATSKGPGPARPATAAAPDATGSVVRKPGSNGNWTWDGGKAITVGPGDTIDAIARRHGVPASAIIQANNIQPPATIYPGQRLVIPRYVSTPPATAAAPATRPVAAAPAPTAAPAVAATPAAGSAVHVVAAGDTLSKISRLYHKPVGEIAKANNIQASATLNVGDRLVIPGAPGSAAKPNAPAPGAQAKAPAVSASVEDGKPVQTASMVMPTPDPIDKEAAKLAEGTGALPKFRWPANGRVIAGYGPSTNGQQNDGINIALPENTPVKAAEDGVVAYAGSELKGYGNLVLVRHPNGYVTAYAHTKEILVKRGDQVKRGQVIARSGQTGNVNAPQLHFEIRKGASPLDPTRFLNGA